ncbi:hypothetical protein J8273_8433 [Carpediemonas membranifera]|uniref:Uncharacterized protein n=1 Tax=Carpediemonas membranifera TaxID=201153 RepID=A0A8J6AZL8_9EUKA|nr:hypothetical protein J8273_8433 [Carpediemonas membranifera]|eukprot:KAG9389759.1 hypothetical protein J8273_8433 [Carpediemonas membranifera]
MTFEFLHEWIESTSDDVIEAVITEFKEKKTNKAKSAVLRDKLLDENDIFDIVEKKAELEALLSQQVQDKTSNENIEATFTEKEMKAFESAAVTAFKNSKRAEYAKENEGARIEKEALSVKVRAWRNATSTNALVRDHVTAMVARVRSKEADLAYMKHSCRSYFEEYIIALEWLETPAGEGTPLLPPGTGAIIDYYHKIVRGYKKRVKQLRKSLTAKSEEVITLHRRLLQQQAEREAAYDADKSMDASLPCSPIPPQSGTVSRTSCPRRDTDEAQAAMSVKRKALIITPEKARPEDSEEESEEEEEPVEEVESEEEEEPVADELMEELHFGDLEGGNSGDDEDVCSASAQATAPNDLADPIDLNFTPEMKDIIAQHSPAKSKSEEEQEEEKAESDEEGGAEEEGETEESGRVVNARSDPTRYNRTVAFDMIITTRLPSSGWPTYPTLGYGNCIIHCLMMMSGLRTFTAFRRKLPLSQKLKAEDEATAYRQTLLAHARTMAVFSKMTEIELLDELFPGHVNSDGTVTRWACVEAIRVWTSMTGKPTMLVNIDEKMITHIYRNEKGNALTVRRPFDGDQSRALESFRAECARLDINYVIQLMGRHATLRKVSKPTQVKIRRRKN